ncbi:hypothetical protein CRG86_010150 [Photobacterium leiognathi]|nr:hypothetical protein CRG86_010150 [Photobacterium leiognathi]
MSKLFGSKQFEFKLNKESINQYINIGYIMGDSTLFESVNRILPSRIISIDSNSLSKKEKLYWRWSENRRVKISYDEAVDLVHTKFQNSVDRSIQGKSKISLTLSGGLDSRALLAAVKNSKHKVDICCFTFGEENCEDIKIASDVATLAGVKHIKKQLINDNWLSLRKNGLRITDGMENIIHMHGLSVVEDIISHSEHVLNGYLGDLVFGGSWLHEGYLGSENLIEFANKKLGELADKKTLEDSYFEHSSTDPYFIFNRGVRFTSYGSDLTSDKLNIIKPFMDVDLIDLLYSLPDSWRLNGRIYQDMLIKYYPEYFENIPWQSTGNVLVTEVR